MNDSRQRQATDVFGLIDLLISDERLIEAGPYAGLQESGRLASDREFRLFACACARELYQPLNHLRGAALEVAEKEADNPVIRSTGRYERLLTARRSISAVQGWIWCATCPDIAVALRQTAFHEAQRPLATIQLSIFRSMFGIYFVKPIIAPVWLTPQVKSIAESCYQERVTEKCPECIYRLCSSTRPDGSCGLCGGKEFIETGRLDPNTMAVLADALQEAGCSDESILQRLRGKELCLRHPTYTLDGYRGRWSTTEKLAGVAYPIDQIVCAACGVYGNEPPGWQPRQANTYRGDLLIDLLTGRRKRG